NSSPFTPSNTSDSTKLERWFNTKPNVPSSLCSQRTTTERSKLGSNMNGSEINKTPCAGAFELNIHPFFFKYRTQYLPYQYRLIQLLHDNGLKIQYLAHLLLSLLLKSSISWPFSTKTSQLFGKTTP